MESRHSSRPRAAAPPATRARPRQRIRAATPGPGKPGRARSTAVSREMMRNEDFAACASVLGVEGLSGRIDGRTATTPVLVRRARNRKRRSSIARHTSPARERADTTRHEANPVSFASARVATTLEPRESSEVLATEGIPMKALRCVIATGISVTRTIGIRHTDRHSRSSGRGKPVTLEAEARRMFG
jgi:hypothetical protein